MTTFQLLRPQADICTLREMEQHADNQLSYPYRMYMQKYHAFYGVCYILVYPFCEG